MTASGCMLPGLLLLTSILLYMLAVNDEVGHRPKAAQGHMGPKFMYTYNWSMWNAVSSYIFVNISAVVNVYLFQKRSREEEDLESARSGRGAEFGLASMKKLVQLIQIGGRRRQGIEGASEGSVDMVELAPITIV